jgi:cytochrome c oxidase subunit II
MKQAIEPVTNGATLLIGTRGFRLKFCSFCFLSSSCVLCHTIRGTSAGAKAAPDLTHLASRQTLAAGTLRNSPGHLAGWLVDSQGIKPGNKMPPNSLTGTDLQALLAYLESLK